MDRSSDGSTWVSDLLSVLQGSQYSGGVWHRAADKDIVEVLAVEIDSINKSDDNDTDTSTSTTALLFGADTDDI